MKQYVVDAFTDKVFSGNPAAVIILEEWLTEELMIAIAKENNLSETAFTVKEGEHYHLRWFTPGGEIDLCGHATLGTAAVLFRYYEKDKAVIQFDTLSGELIVERKGDLYEMDFPAYTLKPSDVTEQMTNVMGVQPSEAYIARDLVLVFESEDVIRQLKPDLNAMLELDGLLVQATAKGDIYDCVTRSFAPKLNVDEDPVCGSGHCHVIPLWKEKLGKSELVAEQASARGGILYCNQIGDRIKMAGKVAFYSCAELMLEGI